MRAKHPVCRALERLKGVRGVAGVDAVASHVQNERAWLDFVDGRMASYNATSRDKLDIVVDGANEAAPTTVVFVSSERYA